MRQIFGKSHNGNLKEAVRGISNPQLLMLMSNSDQFEAHVKELEELFPGQGLADLYRRRYGYQYQCSSPDAARLWNLFSRECDRYKILYRMKDIIPAYQKKYQMTQLGLFDIH